MKDFISRIFYVSLYFSILIATSPVCLHLQAKWSTPLGQFIALMLWMIFPLLVVTFITLGKKEYKETENNS